MQNFYRHTIFSAD